MAKNLKLWMSTDEFVQQETTSGKYQWAINGEVNRYAQEVNVGEIYGFGLELTYTGEQVQITCNDSAFTSSAYTDASGNVYYGVDEVTVNPEASSGDYFSKYITFYTGDTSGVDWCGSGGEILKSGLLVNNILYPLTGGLICTNDATEFGIYYNRSFTKTDTTLSIIPDGESEAYEATVYVSEDGDNVYGIHNEMGGPNIPIFTGETGSCIWVGSLTDVTIEKTFSAYIKRVKPAVGFLSDTKKVIYNYVYPKMWKIRATYNITDISEPVKICGYLPAIVEKAVLDDATVIWDDKPDAYWDLGREWEEYNLYNGMESAYTFSTTGIHTIDFYVNSPNLIPYGFSSVSSLVDIVLPEGITYLPTYFFWQNALSSLTIPASVTGIHKRSVASSSVTRINFAGTLKQWCEINFYGGGESFFNESKDFYINGELVDNLVIPSTIPYISPYAFERCPSITAVTVENGVISGANFNYCGNLQTVTLPGSISTSSDYQQAFSFSNCSGLTSVTLNPGITRIPREAFYQCKALTGITIPDTVESIGMLAFEGCTGLTEVVIPSSVTTLEYNSFRYCNQITSITLNEGLEFIDSGALQTNSYIKNITIPGSVTGLGTTCFSDKVEALTFLDGPDALVLPWKMHFANNTSYPLRKITILRKNVTCSQYAFSGSAYNVSACTINSNSLFNQQTWASGTSALSSSNYLRLDKLANLTIGSDVTNIPDYAMDNLTGLTEIHCLRTTPPTITRQSFSKLPGGTLYVPTGCTNAYLSFSYTLNSSGTGGAWTIVEE